MGEFFRSLLDQEMASGRESSAFIEGSAGLSDNFRGRGGAKPCPACLTVLGAKIRPAASDEIGGRRRHYRPSDLVLLRRIRALVYDQGYTLRGARQVLQEPDRMKADIVIASDDDALLGTESSQSLPDNQSWLRQAISDIEGLRDRLRRAEHGIPDGQAEQSSEGA